MCIRTTPISCAILNNADIMEYNLLKSSMNKITTPTTVYEDKQYFYLSDHLGSSSWITDKDGNALQHLSYLPFGEVFANQKASGSSFDAEFKFLGKELDSETGYTKTDNRYYWAEAGVFLSVDPLAEARAWISPYNYSQNNPVGRKDPTGRLDDGWKIDNQNRTITQVSSIGGNKTQYFDKRGVTQQVNMSTGDFIQQAQSQGYSVNAFPQTADQTSQGYSGTGIGWGFSLDINLSLGIGYSAEVGYIEDASGNGSLFYSHGKTGGYEASIGLNSIIVPSPDFKLNDFEGQSMNVNVSTPYILSTSFITDHKQGATKDYYNNNYAGFKVGGGAGAGGSISHTKTTFFQMPKREFNTNIPIYYQRGHK